MEHRGMPSWPRRFCCDEDLALIGYDGRDAAKELAAWHSRGPRPTTQELIDVIRAHGVAGTTVLDVGAGVGAVHTALLEAGAASAIDVEPRDVWWMLAFMRLSNLAHVFRRSSARYFAYRQGQLRGLMTAAGYTEAYDGGSAVGRVVLYCRS
jgi:hypothetical protein